MNDLYLDTAAAKVDRHADRIAAMVSRTKAANPMTAQEAMGDLADYRDRLESDYYDLEFYWQTSVSEDAAASYNILLNRLTQLDRRISDLTRRIGY